MKKIILMLAVMLSSIAVKADEGMWLLPYLQKVNYAEMKKMGLKLTAEQIYNANGSSLKDAIVIFAGGCTGEIVSPEGLIFTNHHCGFGAIQSLSSVEHDYLGNGYWAMSREEELPAPGLSIRFIRKIEEVTNVILNGITDEMSETERQDAIDDNIRTLSNTMKSDNPGMRVEIKDFFGGNNYFAFLIEVYTDVRLVGTPPQSVGKFGGDTDNWMWPRHTGDFSIFRVYGDKDGKPADYSEENVPLQTKTYLKISNAGYKEGDFTMVMGFPGTTQRYMTTYELDEMTEIENPNRIFIRGEKQAIWKKHMEASDEVRIKYASKYAQSANYWKNAMGMNAAIANLGVRAQKQALEDEFTAWAAGTKYENALPLIKTAIGETKVANGWIQYLSEALASPFEAGRAAYSIAQIIEQLPDVPEDRLETSINGMAEQLYKDYDETTERETMARMIEIVMQNMRVELQPSFIADVSIKFDGDIKAYVNYLYDNSAFANGDKFKTFMRTLPSKEAVEADPAYVAYSSVVAMARLLMGDIDPETEQKFEEGHRLYIAGLMEMKPKEKFAPDANFTIRLTYGTVKGYSPADAVQYDYYTTLKGVLEKEDPSNFEFIVPAKLKELIQNEDYGRWADFTGVTKAQIKAGDKGHLNACFLTTNDITGGNSGSPVLNAKGELIGLAFDGNWESLSGDVIFENNMQRCISLDVRYVLFMIDKFAGDSYILNELTIVE